MYTGLVPLTPTPGHDLEAGQSPRPSSSVSPSCASPSLISASPTLVASLVASTSSANSNNNHRHHQVSVPVALMILSALTYSGMSMMTTLTNKAILSSDSFADVSSLFLLLWQHIASVLLLLIARWQGWVTFQLPERSQWYTVALRMVPLDILFCVMLYTNTQAVRYISVPVLTVIKSLSTVLTCIGDAAFYKQHVHHLAVWGMLVMVLSAIVAGFNDLAFDIHGYIWAGLNCVVSAVYVLWMRSALKGLGIGEFGVAFLNNALALFFITPMVVLGGYLGPGLEAVSTKVIPNLANWSLWLLNGFVGFALSVSSFWCVGTTSPTTYSMVGALNKVPLAIFGWIFFKAPMTSFGVASVFTGLAGGVLYTIGKTQKKPTAPPQPPPLPTNSVDSPEIESLDRPIIRPIPVKI